MEEKEYRLNPMLPRRFNSRQRAEIRQKEKEIIEEATKKFELKEKRKKEICSNTDYIEKILDILKRKDFICDAPRFDEEMSDLNNDEKKILSELSIFWEGICDYTSAHHIYGIMRLDEKIRYGMAYSSRIIKYGEELINISMYDANANTDYNNSQEYYYGCSISDDAKRHSSYYEFDLEDVIKFHTDNKDNVKVLQK